MWCFSVIFLLSSICYIYGQSIPLLLLISFDGFRHDYPQIHGPLKNFHRLERRGVHALKMTPTFSTATFPNHYTIVTGLYEETHGVVSNQMYDPKTKVIFEPSDDMSNGDWWPHPAIWMINEQRKGARSGVAGWPQDPLPISKYIAYRRTRPFRELIDQILQWFNDPVEPINFGAIYFDEPDLTGHRTGPYSMNMTERVRQCDEHLGYLLDQIEGNERLRNHLHLIVVSDHGMEQINGTLFPLYIEDFLDMNKIIAVGTPPEMNIFVDDPDQIENVMKNLSRIPHSKSYRRKDIPDRLHYKNHERIGDILLLMEPGFEILKRPKQGGKRYNMSLIHGNHGYDNEVDSMKAIFYAMGPQFKRNFTLDKSATLNNVDLFGLMCFILNIDPCPPSNGSLKNIQPFLLDGSQIESLTGRVEKNWIDTLMFTVALFSLGLFAFIGIIWSIKSFFNIFTVKKATSLKSTPLNEYKSCAITERSVMSTDESDIH